MSLQQHFYVLFAGLASFTFLGSASANTDASGSANAANSQNQKLTISAQRALTRKMKAYKKLNRISSQEAQVRTPISNGSSTPSNENALKQPQIYSGISIPKSPTPLKEENLSVGLANLITNQETSNKAVTIEIQKLKTSQMNLKVENQKEAKALSQKLTAQIESLYEILAKIVSKKNPTVTFAEMTNLYNEYSLLDAKALDERALNLEQIKLYQAMAYFNIGLVNESRELALQLLKSKNKGVPKESAIFLIETAQKNEIDIASQLIPYYESVPNVTPAFLLNLALHASKNLEPKNAIESLKSILKKASLLKNTLVADVNPLKNRDELNEIVSEIQFLQAVAEYKTKNINGASALLTQIIESTKDKSLQSTAHLTRARILFQMGNYKSAFEDYLRVEKNHPEWPQAMIEQAWSQIQQKDYTGAAGNMFSLHTEFFSHTFAPESYIVRTVSYLNICQFADGAKVLKDFKTKYSAMDEASKSFSAKLKTEEAANLGKEIYESLRVYISGDKGRMIRGLPRPLLQTFVKSKSFEINQGKINQIANETEKIDEYLRNSIQREKNLIKEISQLSEVLTKLSQQRNKDQKNDNEESEREEAKLESKLVDLKRELQINRQTRKSVRTQLNIAKNHLEKKRDSAKSDLYQELAKEFRITHENLSQLLEQVDILKYEVYSKASEHLRVEGVAAGNTATNAKKDPTEKGVSQTANSEAKPNKRSKTINFEKNVNWDFNGEIWEDELGHFQSSLVNVCPESGNEEAPNENLNEKIQNEKAQSKKMQDDYLNESKGG